MYNSDGNYVADDRFTENRHFISYKLTAYKRLGVGYDTGDLVAVCLEVNGSTVAFRKNGVNVVPPRRSRVTWPTTSRSV